ncbi:flavin reductase [Modestobacter excelsi]|uniref:flavin reductase n=1 Tax=Modestobacter excelsi TaxID=2213161 RepID=UPI001C20DEFF|nr:flavin reductase [Modestobacter excelsi]
MTARATEPIDPALFRQVLGQYPTGVVIVTAMSPEGQPLGMTVGSFTSVSLDPPLVAFLPDKKSNSWRAIRESGAAFCVNVLGADQERVCRTIAVRKTDKFADVDWWRSPGGNPVITGCVAFIDCTTEVIHDSGDHHIVVGRVQHLDVENQSHPLLFFRGGYGSFTPLSLAAVDADLLGHLRLVDLARPHMDSLAARFATEVTAVALVRDELVLAAAAGQARTAVAPTRVGLRMPFMPPLGSALAAWGGESVLQLWLSKILRSGAPDDVEDECRRAVQRVRARGYALAIGHEKHARLEEILARFAAGDPDASPTALRDAITRLLSEYNPEVLAEDEPYELRLLSAPVFHPDGQVAFMLSFWGPPGVLTGGEIERWGAELLETAAAASAAIRLVLPSGG